jgi:hypothetical protein
MNEIFPALSNGIDGRCLAILQATILKALQS